MPVTTQPVNQGLLNPLASDGLKIQTGSTVLGGQQLVLDPKPTVGRRYFSAKGSMGNGKLGPWFLFMAEQQCRRPEQLVPGLPFPGRGHRGGRAVNWWPHGSVTVSGPFLA